MTRTAIAIFLAVALGAPGTLMGQTPTGAVRGVVQSSEGERLSSAQIELLPANDTTQVGAALSNADGAFIIRGVADGSYRLRIGILGFGDAETVEFSITGGLTRDVGTVELEIAALAIEEVVVNVERPDVAFEPDRTGYLVDALGASGGAITDAIRGIPDLDVDIDGNVELRGQRPAIYIDGRPAPMDDVSLAIFLEQFPADQIERIEVIDVPPARFRAEGSSGIVNIVLKEGVELGVNGNVAVSAGTRGQRTVSGRATMQRGPWTLNGGLNTRWSDSQTSDFTVRQNLLADPVTFLEQESTSDRSMRSLGGRVEIRRELSERARLWTRLSADGNGSDRDGATATAILEADRDLGVAYDRLATSDDDFGSANVQAGFDFEWEPDEHTFEIEISRRWNDRQGRSRDEIEAEPAFFEDDLGVPWLTVREEGSGGDRTSFEVDYARPLGESLGLEIGGSFDREDESEDQLIRQFLLPDAPMPDSEDSRLAGRVQNVSSGYITLQRAFGRAGVQAGVRTERLAEDLILPLSDDVQRTALDFFPSVNLSWSAGRSGRIRIGYSQRIRRPGLNVLDPTDRSTDPLNRQVGNPEIDDSRTHNVVGRISWNSALGNVFLNPYWTRTNDGWERVTTVDQEGVSTRSYANLASRTRFGTSASLRLPRLRGWRGRVSLSLGHSTIEGSVRGNAVNDGQFLWSSNGSIDGPLFRNVSLQGSFGYDPPNNLAQGRTSGEWEADFGFRYRLLDDRASLRLAFNDPFLLERSREEIRDPSVIQTGRSRVNSRRVSFTLSYAFSQGADVRGGGRGGFRGGGRGPR